MTYGEFERSYALTKCQSLAGICKNSAGNGPVIPRSYSIPDFCAYRRELSDHRVKWPTTVPIGLPTKSIYLYRPYWTYRTYWPHFYYRNYCNPMPYEYKTDPFFYSYPYSTWTKYRANWYDYSNPYFYRRYYDSDNVYYNSYLRTFSHRALLAENLFRIT